MLKATLAVLAVSLAVVGCGISSDRLVIEERVFQNDGRQSAGNATLAESLRKAKPLVDLTRPDTARATMGSESR